MDVTFELLPTALTLVLTLVSPLIAAWFTKSTMTSRTKNLVALFVSVVIAGGWVFFNGGFEGVDIALALGAVYGLQQLVYNQLLKDVAKDIEANNGITAPVEDNSTLDESDRLGA